MGNSEDREIQLNPEPMILIESLRDIGYSFNSALADIIDNSITAKANEIRVLAVPANNDYQIAIIDDGEGLARNDLLSAMRLGSTDPRRERARYDLGRFGLGLKTASFSQCRCLTVASRCGGEASAFTWDLDRVVDDNKWTLIDRTSDIDSIPFLDKLPENGTLVLWEEIDRISGGDGSSPVDFNRLVTEADEYLSLVFHRYLSGEHGIKRISITLNNLSLEPLDPFNSKHKATQVAPVETVMKGVTMQAFTLPYKGNYASQLEYEKYGLRGGYLKNQGVYLYREKRLILYGTWFTLAKKTALTQLTRVKIDIGTEQDEEWKIDVKKVSAQLPEVVRRRLRTLINAIGAPSRKVFKKRGRRLTSPDVYPVWTLTKDNEKSRYEVNTSHPVIATFRESLDSDTAKQFDAVLGMVASAFPTEAIYYDLSKNPDNVEFPSIPDDQFEEDVNCFFGALKQTGKSDDEILSIMKNADVFHNRWKDILKTLKIEEE